MDRLEDYFRHKVAPQGFDLFAVFARFEYAMKNGAFRRETSADAAWRTFADSLPGDFFTRMQNSPEAEIYFYRPPDHLVTDEEDGVRWSDNPTQPRDAASLFDSIKTARNDLFHGDKAHDNRCNTELMTAALFILNVACEDAGKDRAFDRFIAAMEYGL